MNEYGQPISNMITSFNLMEYCSLYMVKVGMIHMDWHGLYRYSGRVKKQFNAVHKLILNVKNL